MRFGKSTRTLAAVGRRLLGERTEGEHDGIASEERSALLRSHGDPVPMDDIPDEQPPVAGDPTQRLLTALGRFQRQVNKAEGGAPQHLWADECMEQLIDGISIAHENNWPDVKEALTDTARILQSYEDAGVAMQAVPFLQDSYEILCLMVGDIIVDNVRSGVMNKWRQRYHHALNDLARHGVTLIDDESDEPAPAPANIVRFAQANAPEPARAFPFAEPEVEDTAGEDEHTETDAPTLELDADLDAADAAIEEVEAEEEDETEAVEEATDEELEEEGLEEESLEEEVEEEDDGDEEVDAEEALEEVEEDADAEAVEDAETEEEPELPALDENLFEDVEETPAPAQNIVRLEEPARAATEHLFEMPAHTPRVAETLEAVAPVPVRDPDEDVQAMLRNAQHAMSRGDVANAKLVALQVAVKMAELEVSRAKDTLRVAEDRLDDTARAIEIASEAVRRTEAGVADVEEQIAQREGEFQEKRDHISGLREHASTVEATIADIDEQIRALQDRRAAEERNLAFVHDQLEQSLGAESRIQTDLDMLAQEEEAAREALDAARQRVRDLQRERLSRESDINDSRHALKQQERSVEDIQRTLKQIASGPEEEAPTDSGLLF